MKITVYDRNPGTGFGQWFLKTMWLLGCWIQKRLGLVDDYHGAASWDDLLKWAKQLPKPITSFQYWGHGSVATVWLAGTPMLTSFLTDLRPLLAGSTAIVWFRCCNVFQGIGGQHFARAVLKTLGCKVVAHTYVVGLWQSGGHAVSPEKPEPTWPVTEGGELKDPWWPDYLRPWLPNTVFCLSTKVPSSW